MEWLPPQYFYYFYLVITSLLCFYQINVLITSDDKLALVKESKYNIIVPLLLAIGLIYFFGNRPATTSFGDTYYYIHSYNNKEGLMTPSLDKEWLWNNLNVLCRDNGWSVASFFTTVAFFYVGPILFICWKTMRNNILIAFLFCIISFSFYGYGINGIRNGMACSILLVAICFFKEERIWEILLGCVFIAIAYFIHRSTLAPALCMIVSRFFIKKPQLAIFIWFFSILISLIFGNFIGNFIEATGIYDEKMDYFLDVENSAISSQFSSTGFRWDFLLYSSMPVLMTWYITIKRNFNDSTFNLLANTYILANAFWIMVIRASYSNRFAYLSWFIYPIIIAYPLLRMNIWDDQDRKTGIILAAYTAFTILMFIKG